VRLLLDECVPKRLRRELRDHEVRTVPELGWAGKENGELLALAESKFDVLVTVDQKVKCQRSMAHRNIAIVILVARRSKIDFLRPLLRDLQHVLTEIAPGELREVGV